MRIENGHAVETRHSQASATVTGYEPEEFAADPNLWIQMVVPEDREVVIEHARQILSGNDVPPIEHRIYRKDGKIRWMSDTAIPCKDFSGKLLSYDGVIKDITERKQAEQALKAREIELRTIIDSEPECVKLLDKDCGLLQMNLAGLNMIEAESLDQVVGQSVLGIVTPEYRDAFKALTQEVFQGNSGVLEFEIIGFKGTHRWLETHAVPLRDSQGTIVSLLGITRDITKHKQYQAEILRSNTELEQFSYAISHDMRQPLRMISSYMQLLEKNLADQLDSEDREYFNFAIDGAKRMDAMMLRTRVQLT